MRDLAPQVVRQRLLIEALYTVDVDVAFVDRFLHGLAEHLDLRTYAEATIVAPGGEGRDENEGFDAFLPLIDSGISLYVWTPSGSSCASSSPARASTPGARWHSSTRSFRTTDSTSLDF